MRFYMYKMQENIQSGLITELLCQYDFTKFGIVLFAPITTDSRSDFIAEINGIFIKIQCKSSTESADGNSFTFSTASKNWNTKEVKKYQNQIDYFYTSHNKQGYLIPISEANGKQKTLRLFAKDSKNPSISWAEDYEIEKVLKKMDDSLIEFIPHKKEEKYSYCIDCGEKIAYSSIRCKSCNGRYIGKQISTELPVTRGELKDLIRNKPFTTIAKEYGVSDNAIRKWCDKFNLPRLKKEISSYTDEEWKNI